MKNLLLYFALSLFCINVTAQCEPPVVTDWHAENDTVFNVNFLADVNSSEYIINFLYLYNNEGGGLIQDPYVVSWTGSCSTGANEISHNPLIEIPGQANIESYYYKVELATICEGDTIWGDDFYMSRNSLFNDDGFECEDNFFMPFTFLPDGSGQTYNLDFEIEEGDIPLQIDQLQVLLDIGHTYIGDLELKLTSPIGTEVTLMEFPNDFGGSHSFSVLFVNNGPEIVGTDELGSSSVRGIFGPEESFDAFIGEPVSGTWTVSITDNLSIDSGFLFGVCLGMNTSPCLSSVSGQVYYDLNSNDIRDEDELPSSYSLVSTSINGYAVTSVDGDYIKCFGEGLATIQVENLPLYHIVSPESYGIDLVDGDYIDSVDFALQPIPDIVDLSINVFSPIPDRPGFDNLYILDYINIGTECIGDVVIEFEIDGTMAQILDVDFDGQITLLSDTSFSVTIGTLCPNESGSINITIYTEESVEIDDVLVSTSCILPTAGDEAPDDNCFDYNSIVVGSYDPNDKAVSDEIIQPDFLADEKKLEYLVRFQNTGNWYAENVEITDIIDEDLILTSFELLDTSHPVEVFVEGNEFSFQFDNIFLPSEEVDELGSNGFIRFSFQPQPDFSVNDIIENSANIYFDFNEPIITNTVTTILDIADGIEDNISIEFSIYPNPTDDFIYVLGNTQNIDAYNVYDLLGNVIERNNLKSNQIAISSFTKGIYFIEFVTLDGNVLSVEKVIKR